MGLCRIVLAGILAVALFGANVAVAKTVRIGGVGAAMGMLPQLFAAFERTDATKLEVVASLGTSGGLRALSEGALDIAVAGRALTPDELARGLVPAVAVRTPYGFATSHPARMASRVPRLPASSKPQSRHGQTDRRCGSSCARSQTVTPVFLGACFPTWRPQSSRRGSGRICRLPLRTRIMRSWRSACLDL